MTEKLKKLYQEVILHHSKHPVHFVKRENAMHQLEAYNPLCGDKFQLFVDVSEKDISALSFQGIGCAISKASASVMMELLNQMSIEEAKVNCQTFLAMLAAEITKEQALPDSMQAFAAARAYPGRKKCASLVWEEMHQFLDQQTS